MRQRRATVASGLTLYAPWYLNPVILQAGVWMLVLALYLARISYMLYLPLRTMAIAVLFIVIPFVISAACIHAVAHAWGWRRGIAAHQSAAVRSRWAGTLLVFWALGSVGEVIYSRGVPFYWLLERNGKSYMDFGLHSLHGLLDSLLLALTLVGLDRYLSTRNRRHLILPVATVTWAVLLVNRQIIMTLALEGILLFLCYRRLRGRTTMSLVLIGLACIIIFGFIGDLRTGRALFYALAQVRAGYPSWLPSGFLWVYMYLATPLNNLVYNGVTRLPLHNWHLTNTLFPLLPSIFRPAFVRGGGYVEPALQLSSFNMCTGYIGILQDMGWLGVAGLSAFFGLLCEMFWLGNSRRDRVLYSIMASCLLLSTFVNSFFLLPFTFQIFWIFLLYRPKQRKSGPASYQVRAARTAMVAEA